jgi:Xaa-Pro aminopeptidase
LTEDTRPIIANIPRLHELMDRDGLDAVVIRSGVNFTYLAGYANPGTLARHLDLPDSPREVLLLWPRRGEPVLVLNGSFAPRARRDSWVAAIELYQPYVDGPYARLAEVLKAKGLDEARLGFEPSTLSALRWNEVQTLLPKAQLIDCATLMAEVRWIKTAGEIELLKQAADVLDAAYLEVFPTVRAGDSERDVHSRIVGACIRRGADWAHGMLNSNRNTVGYGGESDLTFAKGDILRNDYVSYYLGYPGHQSRTVVVGTPTDEQRRTYGLMRDIYRAAIEQCRVGARARDIWHFADDQFRRHGHQHMIHLAGHGVGPWFHQQEPYIIPSSDQQLEAGMVIAMEPHVGSWHLQDLILITDDGPILLSDRFSTEELFVVDE